MKKRTLGVATICAASIFLAGVNAQNATASSWRKVKPTTTTSATAKPTTTVPHASLVDGFEALTVGDWAEGSIHGNWRDNFNGFGRQGVVSTGTEKVLDQAPQASTSAGETHASLATSTATFGDLTLSADAKTVQQLRTGTAPNAWERDWIFWHFTDGTHAYYLTCKANGWELGKLDPAYAGAQRFLATGSSVTCPVGSWHTYRVGQVGNVITVWVNGVLLTTFQDTERPYLTGSVGLYSEDAHVQFDHVSAG
jgi:hypothetical protein